MIRKLILNAYVNNKREISSFIFGKLKEIFCDLSTKNNAIRINDLFFDLIGLKNIEHDAHEVFVKLIEEIGLISPSFLSLFTGITEKIITNANSTKQYSRRDETFAFLELPILLIIF